MKYPCVEATWDVECVWGTARLWIDRDEIKIPEWDKEFYLELRAILDKFSMPNWESEVVDACVKFVPGLSAIQLIENASTAVRRGVVVYVTDFNVEKKG